MKKTAIALALTAALAACSQKEAAQEGIPLAFAPADTAFVYGNLEPAPESFVRARAAWVEQFKSAALQSLQRAQQSLAAQGENAARDALLTLVGERLQEPQTLASMGLAFNGLMAAYEVNGSPVLRLQLSDADQFRAFIDTLQTRTGQTIAQDSVGDQPFWYLPLQATGGSTTDEAVGSARLIAAIVGEHLVVALQPHTQAETLAALLGVEKPAQSIISTGALTKVHEIYGYQPYGGSLLVDTQRALTTWLNLAAPDTQDAQASVVCQGELQSLAAKAPRLVAGTLQASDSRYTAAAQLELASDLAAQLAPITAPVPGLGSATSGIEMGLGIHLDQLAGFLQKQANAVSATPYRCEQLQPLNEAIAQVGQALPSLFATAGFFSGIRVHLDAIDTETRQLSGTLLIASRNPMALVGLAQSMLPELASAGIAPDGKARPLQSPTAAMLGADAPLWIASSDKALAIGIGADQQKAVEDALAAKASEPAPLQYYGADGVNAARLMQQAVANMETASPASIAGGDPQQQLRYVLEPLLLAGARMYEDVAFTRLQYVLDGQGLQVQQDVQFK
ncbi:hypothetical protein AAV94_02750 [Lampropedia cohaerens]|uniref:DUF3352 domain-containing protein n=1 Tax=Lampropedia cohaerens TaxID=1610491 RepID=A0A0U1Q2J8_9BURK|nr:hypothetical protein [Lampropedia cohaerens]KKW68865.1 hypothetical protein AAV94_02750 [Lampropedia cohaerens]